MMSPLPAPPGTPPVDFEYDPDLVLEAAQVIGVRSVGNAYRKSVRESLQVPEEPEEGGRWHEEEAASESGDDDDPAAKEPPSEGGRDDGRSVSGEDRGGGGEPAGTQPRHSTKEFLEAWGAQRMEKVGELPAEMLHLLQFGFFVVQTFPFWYICLVEHLALMPGRNFAKLFKKATKDKRPKFHDRWDVKRKMNTIVEEDFLSRMITGPLEHMMTGFGLLDVVGGTEKRVVGVCGSLLSRPQRAKESKALLHSGLQGMHADMDVFFQWMANFGFSCITAGCKTAYLDIYPASWDGGRGIALEPARVDLPPGCSVVFHGLARHRGVSYPYESLRLFVSFVVRSIVDLASREKKVAETNQLEYKTEQEPVAVPLVEWKGKYVK